MQENNDHAFLFYKIMRYPVPMNAQYFQYQKKHKSESHSLQSIDFSRPRRSHRMEEYLEQIKKVQKRLKWIPFVQESYLCNSMTFNMLTETSDIDIVIVTQNHRLRIARFFSVSVFRITGLKRSLKNPTKKVCLSFTLEERATNLYSISLKHDIYLAYWIAHLVPIYSATTTKKNRLLFSKNHKRVSSYLPNIHDRQMIFLGNNIIHGKSIFRVCCEKVFGFGGINKIIQLFRSPILHRKTKHLGENKKDIIINDKMLKFYKCKRKQIQEVFEKSL